MNRSPSEFIEINLHDDFGINMFDRATSPKRVYMAIRSTPEIQKFKELERLNRDSMSAADILRSITEINILGEKLGFRIVFI